MKASQLIFGASAYLLTTAAFAGPLSYSITDLGFLGEATVANAINDRGHVVGDVGVPRATRAYSYADGVYTVLDNFGGVDRAFDINSSGQIVGTATNPASSQDRQAFLYANGVSTSLGTFGGRTSIAYAINDQGQVAGAAANGAGKNHAFLYANGVMQDLGTLGGAGSIAYNINNGGQVVGHADTASGADHVFVYADGVMQDLGTMGADQAWGLGINDFGVVVGMTLDWSQNRAFRYENGVAQDLGSLDGGVSGAYAVNNAGSIVGFSSINGDGQTGFVWQSGSMYDLNSLIGVNSGWTISDAYDINARGQILVQACHNDGRCNSLLLNPNEVPEPSSLAALLAATLAMSGAVAVRRRRK